MSKLTEQLIDTTSFENIWNYLLEDPKITTIIDVRDQDLPGIADLCIDSKETEHLRGRCLNEFKRLVEEDLIGIMPKAFPYSIPGNRNRVRIDLDNSVECIRLEPFYLVKDLKQLHK